ncbi:MAG: division/cell wall cluster transcriptional repressor MraZ [Longimicrobiales bacterium]
MQGSAPSRGTKFLGSYQHTLDDKGRISLPAQYRREAADQRFVLVQPYPPSLALYPEVEWGQVEDRLSEMVSRNADGRMYMLSLMANAVEVSPDAQGRILIPQRLKESAGLDGTVLLVGAINKIELWDPTKFQAMVGKAEDYGRFTSQIFR